MSGCLDLERPFEPGFKPAVGYLADFLPPAHYANSRAVTTDLLVNGNGV